MTDMHRNEALPAELAREGYRLECCLGQGGMGAVFKVSHPEHGVLAVKVASSRHDAAVLRFQREAELCAQLKSPNTVRARTDLHRVEGWPLYYLMEFVPGTSLSDLLREHTATGQRFGWDDVVSILLQACDSLAEMHRLGWVHRDLKPANMLLTPAGVLKVIDLGLIGAEIDSKGARVPALTLPGSVIGTRGYRAPEQYGTVPKVSPAADVWSLGVLGFEMLCGQLPFAVPADPHPTMTVEELREWWASTTRAFETPPRPFDPSVPQALQAVVRQCLSSKPEDRPASADEVAFALRQVVLDIMRRARPSLDTRPGQAGSSDGAMQRLQERLGELQARLDDAVAALVQAGARADRAERRAEALFRAMGSAQADLRGRAAQLTSLGAWLGDLADKDWSAEQESFDEAVTRAIVAPKDRPEARARTCPETTQPMGESDGDERMVYLLPGCFLMGSPAGENAGVVDTTEHEAELTVGFWLGRTPVTQAQWQEVMGNNPSYFQDPDRPVEMVNWFDAVAFCNELSRREKLEPAYEIRHARGKPGKEGFQAEVHWLGLKHDGYRLPTEAEWEYAARADGEAAVEDCLDDVAWWNGNASGQTHPVGKKKPSRWGLHDMIGNVSEWVWDWSGRYPSGRTAGYSGPDKGIYRICRGGNWDCADRQTLHPWWRVNREPIGRSSTLGFRIARTGIPRGRVG